MSERAIHISPKPREIKTAVMGFDAANTGVPEDLVPVELTLMPGQFARCMYAIMTAATDAPGQVKVDLEYSLDDYDTLNAARTWTSVFLNADTRLSIAAGMQMRGPVQKFATYPEPLEFRNEWAVGLAKPKRLLIRPVVETAAPVFVRCDLVMEIRKDY